MSKQPDALRWATYLEGIFVSEDVSAVDARKIAAELRRLHAANLDCMAHFDALKVDYDKQQALLMEAREALEPRRPMTDEELREALRQCPHDAIDALRVRWLYAKDFARAVERHHDIGITGEPTADPLQALTDASEKAGLEP